MKPFISPNTSSCWKYGTGKKLLPQLKKVLLDRKLKYIFVSHFEVDECGGLENTLNNELKRITKEQIPDLDKKEILINNLKELDIKFIATGHGSCVKII